MSQIEMTVEKSLALAGNENAPNDLRAIGALSAAALFLHRLDGSCPASTLTTIEDVIAHVRETATWMDEYPDDDAPEATP